MTAPSGRKRHSFIQFYMDDWQAGTRDLTPPLKALYFELCLYGWDKAAPMPAGAFRLLAVQFGDTAQAMLDLLIDCGKVRRNEDGSVFVERAVAEGQRAYDAWEAKCRGGRKRQLSSSIAGGDLEDSSSSPPAEPEPEPEPEPEVEANASTSGGESKIPREALNMVVDAWNAMARGSKLSLIAKMHDERVRKLRARAGEHGVDVLIAAIETIPRSSFLTGGGERGWKMDFDSFLRPDNCAKLIEGAYHNEGDGGRNAWTGR